MKKRQKKHKIVQIPLNYSGLPEQYVGQPMLLGGSIGVPVDVADDLSKGK